jgi:aarF domain-containing kinase
MNTLSQYLVLACMTLGVSLLIPTDFGRRRVLNPGLARFRRSSTELNAATNFRPPSAQNIQEMQRLAKDIFDIASSTGVCAGISRTRDASESLLSLTLEFIQDPSSFQVDGQLSQPLVIRKLFERLGATYIKLGQFIASSPTLFPADYVREFQACLDKGPTVPFKDIESTIEADLGKPLSQLFAFVDEKPLASASVAQVHRARLFNGAEVVIKVRKPGAEDSLTADLGFLAITSKLLEFVNPSLKQFSFSAIVGDIRSSMLDELDFTLEVDNLRQFRTFLDQAGITDATAPEPYPELSGKRVLTMEYLEGVPLVDLEGISKYSANPEETLVAALRTWALSVATADTFHADVHAGNLLVLEDGRVAFIDFGLVSRISPPVWKGLGALFDAFLTEDYQGVARALAVIGATDVEVDVSAFGRDLEGLFSKINDVAGDVQVSVVGGSSRGTDNIQATLDVDDAEVTELVLELVKISESAGLKFPREFGILLKQALYFDRYQKLLAPDSDPLRDPAVRSSIAEFQNSQSTFGGRGSDDNIIDAEIVG